MKEKLPELDFLFLLLQSVFEKVTKTFFKKEIFEGLQKAGVDVSHLENDEDWHNKLTLDLNAIKNIYKNTQQHNKIRVFSDAEIDFLDKDCINYLIQLENFNMLTALQREIIIDYALFKAQQTYKNMSLSEFKLLIVNILTQEKSKYAQPILHDLLYTQEKFH